MVFGDFASTSSASWARTQVFLTTEHVGGIVMSVGGPMAIAEKLNAMQRLSAVPLLVGADLEFGAGYRARGGYFLPNAIDLGGATIFPPEMGIGATRDTSLAYEQGRITAVEGRALGIHLAFAPILDVNNNPANPVIGVRSFGEEQRLDASLGAAMVALPAILGDSSTPATLSPRIMTDLLRHDLGFRGLLITDAMDMNGVLASVRPGRASQVMTGTYGTITSIGLAEACKRALEAGADVLLMPSDVPAAIDAVVAGVQEGRFTITRVDSSVRRLLEAKERLGLHRNRFVNLDSVQAIVGDSNNLNVARRAAELSITLAKDSLHLVPLARGMGAAQRVLAITMASRSDLGANVAFLAELRRGLANGVRLRTEYVNPDDAGTNYARLLAAADSADLVLLCSYLTPSYSSASASAAAPVIEFMRAISQRKARIILVNFGNPYLYQQLPTVPAYIVAWGGFPVSQRAAAQALLGVNAITGRLPISIPPFLSFGTGEMRPAVPALSAPAVSPP
jgi:beta-N-acetylhexosaminidase